MPISALCPQTSLLRDPGTRGTIHKNKVKVQRISIESFLHVIKVNPWKPDVHNGFVRKPHNHKSVFLHFFACLEQFHIILFLPVVNWPKTDIFGVSKIWKSPFFRHLVYMLCIAAYIFVAVFTGPEEHGVAAPGCKIDQVDNSLLIEGAQHRLDGRKVTLRAGLL